MSNGNWSYVHKDIIDIIELDHPTTFKEVREELDMLSLGGHVSPPTKYAYLQ